MNAIKRTAEALKLLAEHPRRLTGIARELQLTQSTAHRLLRTIEQTELIKKIHFRVATKKSPNVKKHWTYFIRKLGHSTVFGERILGSASDAATNNNYICPVVLNIFGQVDRFSQGLISDILEEMKYSAARISEDLNPGRARLGDGRKRW